MEKEGGERKKARMRRWRRVWSNGWWLVVIYIWSGNFMSKKKKLEWEDEEFEVMDGDQ